MLRESNLECGGIGRETDCWSVDREATDVREAVRKILLFDSAFGIPDDEAIILTIKSDDTGVVWFGGQEQSVRGRVGHFKGSDFLAARKLSE